MTVNIGVPRGMESHLIDLLKIAGVEYTITDKRNHGVTLDVKFNGELYDEQLPAAKALLSRETGVLSAKTAFGKSVVGAYAISKNAVNTLVLVHTAALLTLTDENNVAKIYNELMESESRNRLIVADITEAVNDGKTPIVLTERAEHVKMLDDKCKNVITLTGKMSVKEKRETIKKYKPFPKTNR